MTMYVLKKFVPIICKNFLKLAAILCLSETIIELTCRVDGAEVGCLWGRSSCKIWQVFLGLEVSDFSWFSK